MANNINWGKIYGATWWGNTTNNISWGKSYISLLSNIANAFKTRVLGLGGIVESDECIEEGVDASFYLKPSGYGDNKVYAALPEDGSGDLNFSRVSEATRVNAEGNIEVLSRLGSELVTNGTFETILGNELITNGGFEDGISGWFLSNECEIVSDSGGNNAVRIYSSDGAFQYISQSNILEVGKTYKLEFDVISTNGATLGMNNVDVQATTLGRKEVVFVSPFTYIQFKRSSGITDITIDNISVKEVTEGYIDDTELLTNGDFEDGSSWTLGTGWSISNNSVNCDGTQLSNSTLVQQNGVNGVTLDLVVGKQYELQFDATVISGAITYIEIGGDNNFDDILISDSYKLYFLPTSTNKRITFAANSDFIGSIDNISVKEVVQDNWDLGTGWSIEDGVAKANNASNGSTSTQDLGLIIGKKYKISYEVKNYVSGGVLFRCGNTFGTNNSSNGVFEEVLTCSASSLIKIWSSTGGTTLDIDNISVKQVIEDGLPRLDYTDGGCPSLLLEPQSTNLIEYSEDFSDSSWYKGNTLVTANQEISPSGYQNADKVTFLGVSNSNIQQSITTTIGEEYTLSIWAKADVSVNNVKISISGDVDLAITDNWQRFSVTFTATSTSSIATLVTRNSVVSDIYIWGAQIEQLPYATSYIPTNGSTVTRVAETLERDNISHLINSEEGVLYVEMKALSNGNVANSGVRLKSDDSLDYITLYYNGSSNFITPRLYKSGASIWAKDINIGDQSLYNKFALKFNSNGADIFVNGVKTNCSGLDSSFSLNKLTTLDFGGKSGKDFHGNIKDVRIYKTALTDEELIDLTTI